ncbi:nuclease SbcCD subunit D [Paenibacillus sp. J31TS4]|uniref:exonuclease SbcCD subunit D n=1 Tax=Paenibacillus sp. J31TS4 TaxID=2807195 RepID=UPI001B26496F|nr:exonuclease SbcCD subunit D [Paenibacillus sp. J31TS4]GIP39597.1 nuclease SbcCD subunit D [Paenibacillus sp. J31TS4]
MRILHTADWHFGRTLEGRSRQQEQEQFVDELVRIADDQQIDLVLMAGDVYDSVNPPAASEKLFYEAMSRLAAGGRRRIAVIAGNHDNPDRIAASAPLAGGHGITLVGLPTAEPIAIDITRTGERAMLYALPYPSEARLAELLSADSDEAALRLAYSEKIRGLVGKCSGAFKPETVNLIMSHLYVLGGAETDSERPIQVGGAYTVDTGALCVNADYVALGHLHRPQTLKASSPIRYSGSPLGYSFSEAGQAKSVTIVDLKPGGGPAVPEEIFLSCGKPLVRWKADGGIAQLHAWLDEGRDANAWIDLELHLDDSLSMEQIQSLRKSHGGILTIRPVYREQATAYEPQAEKSLPLDEMFRRFYTRQTGGAEPEAELIRLFLDLLQEEGGPGEAAPEGRKDE